MPQKYIYHMQKWNKYYLVYKQLITALSKITVQDRIFLKFYHEFDYRYYIFENTLKSSRKIRWDMKNLNDKKSSVPSTCRIDCSLSIRLVVLHRRSKFVVGSVCLIPMMNETSACWLVRWCMWFFRGVYGVYYVRVPIGFLTHFLEQLGYKIVRSRKLICDPLIQENHRNGNWFVNRTAQEFSSDISPWPKRVKKS